ncbi:MAG: RNA chaperone Hfq [Tissierellia bacterium]|nr:RNA chaperone Hfq [Tissierellia bacterium]
MKNYSMQDRFLDVLKKKQISVTIFLVSGYQIRGNVIGFDNYTVIIKTGDVQQLIYKHAISTMVPGMNIDFMEEDDV